MALRRPIAALIAALLSCVPALGGTTPMRDLRTSRSPSDWDYARSCASLVKLSLPHAQIVSAELNSTGIFIPPGETASSALTGLPQFCDVVGFSAPTSDSHIGFSVWIPTGSHWNTKYEQVGNGGFAGVVNYSELAAGAVQGYAVAGTDDGHQTASVFDGSWALGHPQKVIDYGYRALKETTDKAKLIISAFTGYSPHRSYFFGCSDGGREALMEAQRYPTDFDGIIVGSPVNFLTHNLTTFVWNERAILDKPTAYLSPAALAILSNAALALCAGTDGGIRSDGFLNDPRTCRFDPRVVQCKSGASSAACLSAAQVTAARKLYDGARNPITGAVIFPGLEPGNEAYPINWPLWVTGASAGTATSDLDYLFGQGYFANFIFANPAWTIGSLNYTNDVALTDAVDAPILNSTNPNLTRFAAHGGKIIQYAGWSDAALAPKNGLDYYNSVLLASPHFTSDGEHGLRYLQSFYRVFMAPGVSHCSGGPGPNTFGNTFPLDVPNDPAYNIITALNTWVEDGVAPDRIIATKYVNDTPADGIALQRPLCVYPLVSKYRGSGSPLHAGNFACEPDRKAFASDLLRAFQYLVTNGSVLYNPRE